MSDNRDEPTAVAWVPVNIPHSKVYHLSQECTSVYMNRLGSVRNRVPTTLVAAEAVGLRLCATCRANPVWARAGQ